MGWIHFIAGVQIQGTFVHEMIKWTRVCGQYLRYRQESDFQSLCNCIMEAVSGLLSNAH